MKEWIHLLFEYTFNPYVGTNYGDLINQFIEDYGPGFVNEVQHNFFVTEKIIDPIAQGLFDYANSKGISVSMDYCEKLAWGGLQTANVYETLSTTEQQEISDVLSAELDTRYTFNGHTYKGNTPCD
jgi:hypothetical protein